MSTLRDKLAAVKLNRIEVDVPDYGTVWVQQFTARQAYESGTSIGARIVFSVQDQDGKPLFTDKDKSMLDGLPWESVQPFVEAMAKVNNSDKEAAKREENFQE